jgi:hypothetical protein
MSLQARQSLVNSPKTFFQRDTQRSDLLDPSKTQTQLIALLLGLVAQGNILEFTAICTDHHDDSGLSSDPGSGYPGTHAHGWAADCWPLASETAGDYLDAGDPRFQAFLHDVGASPWLYQVGLAGSADTGANHAAAGSTCFSDDGADHVHLGTRG